MDIGLNFKVQIGSFPEWVTLFPQGDVKTSDNKPLRVALSTMDDEFIENYITSWSEGLRSAIKSRREGAADVPQVNYRK